MKDKCNQNTIRPLYGYTHYIEMEFYARYKRRSPENNARKMENVKIKEYITIWARAIENQRHNMKYGVWKPLID